MKILVTGVNGQLGHDVMNELAKRNIEALGCGRAPIYKGTCRREPVETMAYRQLDITDKRQVFKTIQEYHPDAVIHCAAWTAVDAAEEPEETEVPVAEIPEDTAEDQEAVETAEGEEIQAEEAAPAESAEPAQEEQEEATAPVPEQTESSAEEHR